MQQLKLLPLRFSKVFAMIAALGIGVSLDSGSRSGRAIAQTPLMRESTPSPAQTNSLDMQPEARFCQSDLQAAIAAIVESPRFKSAQWGIVIKPISAPTTLYERNADRALIPASNVKLLTTAAALQIFGESQPDRLASLGRWLTIVNRYSDNNQANSLLRRIGGQTAARNALASLGVNANEYRQVDGSGLSRNNRATPATFMAILEGMYAGNIKRIHARLESELFFDSLAIAGVNGTLRHRFHNTPLQGRLHGKTGTLRGVRALSGYLENAEYGLIAFSIVVNQPSQAGQALVQAIDQIVLHTAQVDRCN
jgi:D-alanyl-D-alanine carboxypeptidase/D-alanyl-D-alanine-endopeptidase (penicillin-binding protein 4)